MTLEDVVDAEIATNVSAPNAILDQLLLAEEEAETHRIPLFAPPPFKSRVI